MAGRSQQTDPHQSSDPQANYGTTITEINGADQTTDVVSSSEDTHTDRNAFGDATGETDPNAEHTTDAVDNLGRPILVTPPAPADGTAAAVETNFYSPQGDVLQHTNTKGQTFYGYDTRGFKISETDPNNRTTYLQYDLAGRLTRLTDPDGNVTDYEYDDLDRKISETTHDANGVSHTSYFAYDKNGNQTRIIDRDGRTQTFAYDTLGRETGEQWFAADGSLQNTVAYTYYNDGQLKTASDSFSSYAYTYDDLQRPLTVDNAGTPNVPHVVLTTSYAAQTVNGVQVQAARSDGLRTGLTATIGTGNGATTDFQDVFAYDSKQRLADIYQFGAAAPKSAHFDYNDDNQFTHITRFADLGQTLLAVRANYGRDGAGRLTSIAYVGPSNAALHSYGWHYDDANRVDQITGPDGTSALAYDNKDQLLTVTNTNAGGQAPANETYTYDQNGNRVTANGRTYQPPDRYNQLTDDGTFTYQFDNEGNRVLRTRKGTTDAADYFTEYGWDNRNRLVSVTFKNLAGDVTKKVEYTYDVKDMLIGRKVTTPSANGPVVRSEHFVYDGSQIVLAFTGDTTENTSSSLTNRYLWGAALDQLLADEQLGGATISDDVLWALTDNQNSVHDLARYNTGTDQTTIVNHIVYDSYGNETSETQGGPTHRINWTGRFFDPDTGLQWNNARWYDPYTGGWINRDPIGLRGGSYNFDEYVGNSPTNGTDANGLETPHHAKGTTNPANEEAHFIGVAKKQAREAAQRAREAEAAARRAADAAHGEATLGAEQILERTRQRLQQQRTALQRTLNNPRAVAAKHAAAVEGITKADKSIADIDHLLTKTPAHLRMSKLAKMGGSTGAAVRKVMKAAGRTLVVAGFAITLLQWKERAAEAGVVRATVEATPVLGDIVVVTDQARELYTTSQEALQAIDGEQKASQQLIDATHRRAVSRAITDYEEAADEIRVTTPEYIDVNAIGDALRNHEMNLQRIISLRVEGRLTPEQVDEGEAYARKELRQHLMKAVHQPGESNPTLAPVY